jgi:K+-transporting ATPase c subunit
MAGLTGRMPNNQPQRKTILATPNYGYEKRQKELAKKKKKEEKLKAKSEKKVTTDGQPDNLEEQSGESLDPGLPTPPAAE